MKLVRALLVGAAVLALLPGCAVKTDYRALVHGYIENTMAVARAFTYTEIHAGHRAQVTGRIADDLRWEAQYTLDGQPQTHEIVADEARALQVTNPALLAGIKVAPSTPSTGTSNGGGTAAGAGPTPSPSPTPAQGAGAVQTTNGVAGADAASLAALRGGLWVEDPTGAKSLVLASTGGHTIPVGVDPVGDALRMLRSADLALSSGYDVRVFSPEAGDYFADLDPFRRPVAGETRYDINPAPQLPPRTGLEVSAAQRKAELPPYQYFQSLAIYVRNGLVDEVRESVEVTLRLQLPDQDLLARIADAGYTLPHGIYGAGRRAQADFIVKTLNSYYAQLGTPLIREHQQSLVFSKLGQDQGALTIPPGLQQASLRGIFDRGQTLGRAD